MSQLLLAAIQLYRFAMPPVHSLAIFPSKFKGRKKSQKPVLIKTAEEARLEAISFAVTHGVDIETAKSIALKWFDECLDAPNSIEMATEKNLRDRLKRIKSGMP